MKRSIQAIEALGRKWSNPIESRVLYGLTQYRVRGTSDIWWWSVAGAIAQFKKIYANPAR